LVIGTGQFYVTIKECLYNSTVYIPYLQQSLLTQKHKKLVRTTTFDNDNLSHVVNNNKFAIQNAAAFDGKISYGLNQAEASFINHIL